jgi:carbonic anhydrase/acetyltransferase-like protein (isoleucine patch superfamily)
MKNIIPYRDKMPRIEEDVYIDPSSRIIGDVLLKRGSSVWPLCVLRADAEGIVVEEEAAILDKVLIESPRHTLVGKRALISHGAILHGCTVGEGALIGIGAILLDGVVVGSNAMIGAGSVVSPGMVIPERTLVLGVPGKVIRPLAPEEVEKIKSQVADLREKARHYRAALKNA